MTYQAPVEEVGFYIRNCTAAIAPTSGSSSLDGETIMAVLTEAGAFAEEVLLPLDKRLDRQGVSLDGMTVRTARGHREAYATFREGGWLGLSAPVDYGGQALPHTLTAACQEFWHSGSLAFAMGNLLTVGAIEALHRHGKSVLKDIYLPKLVSGEWTATMALTEAGAGSDLSAIRTRAEPTDDARFLIRGAKIFISYGEHDLAENIVHLVLARLPDAPVGSKGLSLFLVPKLIVAADGGVTANDVRCTGIEEKLGQHGSPTCSLVFGDDGGAYGWMVGEPNRGLAAMFTMMNSARLAVAMQGVAVAERATQVSAAFARERLQGMDPHTGQGIPISNYQDVRRMLMTMRATTTAARFLALSTADAIDRAAAAASKAERKAAKFEADIMTPIAKSYCTEVGIEAANTAIQIHGGMGYVEETGVAQLWRDARVTSIYEGTNGIQAIDLLSRKLAGEGQRHFLGLIDSCERSARSLAGFKLAAEVSTQLVKSLGLLRARLVDLTGMLDQSPQEALSAATAFLKLAALSIGGSLIARAMMSCDETALRPKLEEALVAHARFVLPETMGVSALIEAASVYARQSGGDGTPIETVARVAP
ncbi:acyl-CoA dehydrogenase family protein [Agrobacterium sp. CCNWLW71]|uniref:acyl-CoA dehydrogenase family protein n=1 Tax=unclassified Agrobacterium TaxID=2632611 RepID=UPI002FF1BF8D